jgi:17beta-estradiol 17-dehydrogenase / very-long-chain 3-oxoacyl-CoA reductase
MSSITGVLPFKYTNVYAGTKAFNDVFSRAVEMEYYENIDVLSLTPAGVLTNMWITDGPKVISPLQFV